MAIQATYVSANEFRVDGDYTDVFVTNIRVRVDCGGWVYSSVESSSYSFPYTTVVLRKSVLTDPCGNVEIAPYTPMAINIHDHSDDDSGGAGVVGTPPDHEWDGTRLRFRKPDGTWGPYTELKISMDALGDLGDVDPDVTDEKQKGDLLVATSTVYHDRLPIGSYPEFLAVASDGESLEYRTPEIIVTGTAGEELAQYDLVYPYSGGRWFQAQADVNSTRAKALGIVLEKDGIAVDSTGSILLVGLVTNPSWSWTPGSRLYVSDTDGDLTQDPTNRGSYRAPVAFAVTSDTIFLFPYSYFLEDILAESLSGIARETLDRYDVVYTDPNNNGWWRIASRDDPSKLNAWGIVVQDGGILSGTTGRILLRGLVENPAWSWPPGAPLYLDIAGDMTSSEPTGNKRLLGYAITSTLIYFSPSPGSGGGLDANVSVTAGENLSRYDVVYVDSSDSGKAKKAKCNGSIGEADAVGIITEEGGISVGSTGEMIYLGPVTNASWSWTPGEWVYVSETPGLLTQTKPTVPGQYVKPFGWASASDTIIVTPQTGWEVSPSVCVVSGPLAATCHEGRIECSSATQLIYTRAFGRAIGLWDGSEVKIYTPSSDIVLPNTANDLDGNPLATNSAYMVFIEPTPTGGVKLSVKKWASPTSRGITLYEWQGFLVHENSEAGRKRRYIGDIYMYNNSGTAEFRDQIDRRFVLNYYNPVRKRVGKDCPYTTTTTVTFATGTDYVRWEDNDTWLVEFLADGRNAIQIHVEGICTLGGDNSYGTFTLLIDCTSKAAADIETTVGYSDQYDNTDWSETLELTEGYHYIYPASLCSASGKIFRVYHVAGSARRARAEINGTILC